MTRPFEDKIERVGSDYDLEPLTVRERFIVWTTVAGFSILIFEVVRRLMMYFDISLSELIRISPALIVITVAVVLVWSANRKYVCSCCNQVVEEDPMGKGRMFCPTYGHELHK